MLEVLQQILFALCPALAVHSSMDQWWYIDADFLVQLQLLLSVSVFFPHLHTPTPPYSTSSDDTNTRHTCSWICGLVTVCSQWAWMCGTMAHDRKQWHKSPFHFVVHTDISRAVCRNLVCIKLSAVAAVICKSKTFHCAVSTFQWKVHLLKYYSEV